jgi:hypothetical protein
MATASMAARKTLRARRHGGISAAAGIWPLGASSSSVSVAGVVR